MLVHNAYGFHQPGVFNSSFLATNALGNNSTGNLSFIARTDGVYFAEVSGAIGAYNLVINGERVDSDTDNDGLTDSVEWFRGSRYDLADTNGSGVYPLEELDSEDPDSFFKTDTHWSIHGAKLASLAVLSTYGLEKTAVEKLLLQDTFRRVYKVGDLGIKLFPPFGADEWVCANFSMYSAMVYDNGLPNFGRLMVFHKADACVRCKLLSFWCVFQLQYVSVFVPYL
ncbi:hypothetical protein [Alishewanella longhuensis]